MLLLWTVSVEVIKILFKDNVIMIFITIFQLEKPHLSQKIKFEKKCFRFAEVNLFFYLMRQGRCRWWATRKVNATTKILMSQN
jgi:hypothetical protein